MYLAPRAAGTGDAPEVTAAWERGVRVHDLAAGVLERVSGTVTPQAMLAVVRMVDVALSDLDGPAGHPRPVVVCVDVRDPGNLGTVLRSAEAAGCSPPDFLCKVYRDQDHQKLVRAD